MATYGYLAHFGILGQKWGIRRFQNPDGSLTEEGRRRYGIGDSRDYNKNFEDVKNKKIDNSDLHGYSTALQEHSDKIINDLFNKWTDASKEDIENVYKNPKAVDKCVEYLEDQLISYDNVDDEELIDMVIDEFIGDIPEEFMTKSSDYEKTFNEAVDDYYNSVENFTKEIVGDLGDKKISSVKNTLFGKRNVDTGKTFEQEVKNILMESSDAGYIHYLWNHSEMGYDPYLMEDMPKNVKLLEKEFINKVKNKFKEKSKGQNYDIQYVAKDVHNNVKSEKDIDNLIREYAHQDIKGFDYLNEKEKNNILESIRNAYDKKYY